MRMKIMPAAPLMIEHRVIERVVAAMQKEIGGIRSQIKTDTGVIGDYVDFIRVYADRCHHGKEEDILFRELKKRQIEAEHEQILKELIDDHRRGREMTRRLDGANERYAGGDGSALSDISSALQDLVTLYPQHIEKEDRQFFIPVMKYFSQEERDAMLAEEYEFDRQLIHERYRMLTERVEKRFHEDR
jgi:hemerythrin-like domain-containing protein